MDEWGSREYGCIIEEEKPEDSPQFDWKSFYQKEVLVEVEMTISELERELMKSVQLEAGPTVPLDPMWINHVLLARALQQELCLLGTLPNRKCAY